PGLPDNPGLPPIDQPVVLAWQAARAASFGLTLWRGDEAEPLVVERGLTQSSFALGRLDPDTDFRWQVVAVSANNDTTAGPTWRFHTAPAAQKSPGEPADPNPPDGASNVSLTPELSWAPAEGASFYQVFLWPSSEVDPMDPVVRVSEPVFVLVDPLEASHQYSWRVEASNSFGSTSSPTWTFETGLAKGVLFSRGDANADTSIDISDAIFILAFLFLGGADPVCHESLDIDDGGEINITDAVNLLVGLFLGGTEPAPPFPECGLDPTPNDGQTCESFPPCQ
ncbi:MAG: hypothetical protein O7J95_05960, partial [Planctomycetota bacterium]|nr:hypothetical protein [Planctomycetota bacterium]